MPARKQGELVLGHSHHAFDGEVTCKPAVIALSDFVMLANTYVSITTPVLFLTTGGCNQSFHHTCTHLHPGFNWQGVTRVVPIVQCGMYLLTTTQLDTESIYLSISICIYHIQTCFVIAHTLCCTLSILSFFFYSVFRTKTVLFLDTNHFKQKSCFVRIMTKKNQKQSRILKFKSVYHLVTKCQRNQRFFHTGGDGTAEATGQATAWENCSRKGALKAATGSTALCWRAIW